MSGTKEKATGKQSAKGRAGKVSAPEVAQADASDLPGAERSVTLPGHYVAVGASPVSVTPSDAGITTAATSISAEWANRVQRELMNVVLAADGQDSAATPTMPATDDVEVLEIRARSERGFWRCGRFWPREPVHVFVSDDPEGDNEANALEGDVVVESFISHETAERLKAEPHLAVTVLQTVAEKD
ncbi:TPA: hypothetical protein MHW93_20995 [Klebsiella pneumoniae]|uniref:hypothetical protein n=1 Tax=Enterobacterales TaxID=91347 RepID=UPI000E2BA4BB|nr:MULTISPECIES: hypothetical protein [Klebsiella]MBG2648762.1 hypothetical protein [Klebsiella oxytoca]MDA4031307.1 hypothetical protein [Klebsiella pneumoniae]MDZ1511546.1 hypothetical protein [Klebsiella pneumoniae]QLO77272.1 hypothetical protein HV306_09280 [Klebsiella grimontii]WVH74409.1 hypothetical protein VST99_00800 [Klebsiella pneumoniae]